MTSGHDDRFRLPFDGGRPVLLCGHPGSGKTSFARHLVGGLGKQPLLAITLNPGDYSRTGRPMTEVTPTDHPTDAAFYIEAEQALRRVAASPGSIVLVDDLAVLAAPYREPMAEQQAFLDAMTSVVRDTSALRIRTLVVTSLIPNPHNRQPYGAQFWMGKASSLDWSLMWPRHPLVQTPGNRGFGVCGLDGTFQAFRFPLLPADQGDLGLDPEDALPTPRRRFARTPRLRSA